MTTGKHSFNTLVNEVIDTGLCTHCGTCTGLSNGAIKIVETKKGPLPKLVDNSIDFPESLIYDACPGKGLNYPELNRSIFGKLPESWLIGNFEQPYIGYSLNDHIRTNAASAGIITHVLVYLLGNQLVDGVITVKLGVGKPWKAKAIIASTVEEIVECSQSVYTPVTVNEVLEQLNDFNGTLAYVGLPDHISSIRKLQVSGYEPAKKIKYTVGPYVGTIMYQQAIESYMKSNGFQGLEDIDELKYRAGEWPGYMQIKTKSGKVLKAKKFYYNYLIPFFITRSSLYSVDFSNELTDISVGDAWHPKYEKEGKGFSVVVARTGIGDQVLNEMQKKGLITLETISENDAMSMHGHMIDFKKRGAFVRVKFRKLVGRAIPDYGYRPDKLSLSRVFMELIISGFFVIGRTWLARKVIQIIPIKVLGVVFDTMRKFWKNMSKPVKRKGLSNQVFITSSEPLKS